MFRDTGVSLANRLQGSLCHGLEAGLRKHPSNGGKQFAEVFRHATASSVVARSPDRATAPTAGLLFESRETCGPPGGTVRRPCHNPVLSVWRAGYSPTAIGRWRGISDLKSPRLIHFARLFKSTSATATVFHSFACAIGSPLWS